MGARVRFACQVVHCEVQTSYPNGRSQHALEIYRLNEAIHHRLTAIALPTSHSQSLAALGTTCIDHSPATAGLHAHQKSVGAGTTDFGCLVGTFHNDSEGVMVIAAARRAMVNLWTFRYAGPPDISFRLIFRGPRFTAQDL